MEADEILRGIFGTNINLPEPEASPKSGSGKKSKSSEDGRVAQYLNWTNSFITASLERNVTAQTYVDNRVGRMGPSSVKFNATPENRHFIVSSDKLTLYSVHHFCTMKANTGVYSGKWMYELQLGSKGLMQVGWSTTQCKFHTGCGVGDTINSYGYDGSNMRKWNINTQKYGELWLAGDIIGCAINLDNSTIDYYRNGRHLGEAYTQISVDPSIVYFPTVSLSTAECLTGNFGATPIRYPVDGYQLLEIPPMEEVAQATLLFKWLQKTIELLTDSKNTNGRRGSLFTKSTNLHEFVMSIAKYVLTYIGPIITVPYVIQEIFVPLIEDLAENVHARQSKAENSKLGICLDLLWSRLEEQEFKKCLEITMNWLLSVFRHLSLTLEYSDQRRMLILLTKICEHTTTRKYLLESLLFNEGRFAHFMYVKVLDEKNLAEVVHDVWWETDPVDAEVDQHKESYYRASKEIGNAVSEVEDLQIKLALTLLNRSDGTDKSLTSRFIFAKNYKRFIHENFLPTDIFPRLVVPLPITLGCFQRLLAVIIDLWSRETGQISGYIPCRAFYDGSINYPGVDRLGGVLSHLQKTFKNELVARLGTDHEVIRTLEEEMQSAAVYPPAVPITSVEASDREEPRTSTGMFARPFRHPILERFRSMSLPGKKSLPKQEKTTDSIDPLIDLLDSTILLYHLAAKKQLSKAASFEEDMVQYITAVADAQEWYDSIADGTEAESQMIREELLHTITTFKSNIVRLARYTAWAKEAIFSMEKQMHLAWLVNAIILTLQRSSQERNMFRFVPEFYMGALVDLWINLRYNIDSDEGIQSIPEYRQMFLELAEFVCEHFLDPRIIHEDAKDSVILIIAGFVSNPFTLKVLEDVSQENRTKLIRNMFKPYERVAWPQCNWVINKFWQGHGFVYRYRRSPHLTKKLGTKLIVQKSGSKYLKSSPSPIFQAHIKDILLSDRQSTVKFLDSFLNKLNWTFSEFIGWIQEIYTISLRTGIFIDRGQMRTCATCFDLTVLLLRVVEMMCTIAPSIFNIDEQPTSKDLLLRLSQILCHILNRVSSHTNCFQHVVLLQIADLISVDHFPILTAVVGILLALLKDDMEQFVASPTEIPHITRIFLTEPSFQITSLYFVLGETRSDSTKEKSSTAFTILQYRNDVSEEEGEMVKGLIKYLEDCIDILPDPKVAIDTEEMCPICYAFPIEVTFEPCGHQTCRTCIDRQLLNKRECFFCKGTIARVVDLSGVMIHNFLEEIPD